jgi:iron complex outermembrane receptor protein
VGVYVDGIYSVRPQGVLSSIYDLENVEVLRGPQGMSFGRNSLAGSVLLQTKKPTEHLEGELQAGLGDYNRYHASAALNVPVNKALALRVAMYTDKADGWVKPLDRSDASVNTDWLDVVDYRREDAQPLNDTNIRSTRITSLYKFNKDLNWTLAFESLANKTSGAVLLDPVKIENGDFSAFIDTSQSLNLNSEQWRSALKWDLATVNVEYLASFSELRRQQWVDADGGLTSGIWTNNTKRQRSDGLSHELKVVSQNDNQFQWLAGLFWFKEETNLHFAMDHLGSGLDLLFIPPKRGTQSRALYAQADIRLSKAFNVTAGIRRTNDKKYDEDGRSYVFCRDVEIAPARPVGSDTLVFEDFRQNSNGAILPGSDGFDDNTGIAFQFGTCSLVSIDDVRRHTNDTSGLLRLTYNNGGPLMYASISSAYQAGLILNQIITDGEKIINYELGVKAETARLRLGAAVFIQDYQKIDRPLYDAANNSNQFDGTTGMVSGLELELRWLTGRSGTFDFAGSWLQSRYGDYPTRGMFCGVGTNNPRDQLGVCSLKGKQFPRAPSLAFSAGFRWKFALKSASLTPRITLNYSDSVFFSDANENSAAVNSVVANTPQIGRSTNNPNGQDAYAKINIGLAYKPYLGRWSTDVYVNNLTNEMTKYGAKAGIITAQGAIGRYNPPRTVGVRINASF